MVDVKSCHIFQVTLVSVYGDRAQQMKFSLLEASEESPQQRIWWGRTNFKMARLGYQNWIIYFRCRNFRRQSSTANLEFNRHNGTRRDSSTQIVDGQVTTLEIEQKQLCWEVYFRKRRLINKISWHLSQFSSPWSHKTFFTTNQLPTCCFQSQA